MGQQEARAGQPVPVRPEVLLLTRRSGVLDCRAGLWMAPLFQLVTPAVDAGMSQAE